MLLIPNPWTEPRPDFEYSYGGEAHIERPKDPDALSDEEWAQYLFMNSNVKGVYLERWFHAHGTRRWFNIARDTVTYEILAVYEMGQKPPKLPKKEYL